MEQLENLGTEYLGVSLTIVTGLAGRRFRKDPPLFLLEEELVSAVKKSIKKAKKAKNGTQNAQSKEVTWTSPPLRYSREEDVLLLNGECVLCVDNEGTGRYLNIPKSENYKYWLELSTVRKSNDAISVQYVDKMYGRFPGMSELEPLYMSLVNLASKLNVPYGKYWLRILYQHSPMAKIPAISRWLKPDDELPECHVRVLVHTCRGYSFAFHSGDTWYSDTNIPLDVAVIGWIYLP